MQQLRAFGLIKRFAGTYEFNNSQDQPDEIPLLINAQEKISANVTNQSHLAVAQASPNIAI